MALAPQKFREIVFLLLYTHEFPGSSQEETVLMIMQELKVTKRSVLEASGKVEKILEKIETIDKMIAGTATDYSFDRISRIEKTVLRLALYEILFEKSVPPKVAIAEAIRLTRKFGTPEGAHFVNAVTDAIYQNDLKATEEPVLT